MSCIFSRIWARYNGNVLNQIIQLGNFLWDGLRWISNIKTFHSKITSVSARHLPYNKTMFWTRESEHAYITIVCTHAYITIMQLTSLSWVTLLLPVHRHNLFYVAALGQTSSSSTSPYYTLRHCPLSHIFYMYIIIFYSTSLHCTKLLHHHTVRHYPSSNIFYNCITILHSTSPYCTLRHCPCSHFFVEVV